MIEELRATLEDPHARHALFVHFPIALSFFGVVLVIALGALRFKCHRLRLAYGHGLGVPPRTVR